MSDPIDIRALLEQGSPEHAYLLDTFQEAFDEAATLDLAEVKVSMFYQRVQSNGRPGPQEIARNPKFPANGDIKQIIENLVESYIERAPGNGFVGRIKLVIKNGDNAGMAALGTYECFVYIGDGVFEEGGHPGGDDPYGGHFGAPGAPDLGPAMHFDPSVGAPGGYGDPAAEYMQNRHAQMSIEERGMALAAQSANERRLDAVLQQQQFLINAVMAQAHRGDQMLNHVIQLNAMVLGRALPALDVHSPGGGGSGNMFADIIGAVISSFFGGGGDDSKPEAIIPPSPPTPLPAPQHKGPIAAFQPYQEPAPAPRSGGGFSEDDITPEMAARWAEKNPEGAKVVAKQIAPPTLHKMIDKL